MKKNKLCRLKPILLVAVGVFLGRAAQAQNTILTFDIAPGGQANNAVILSGFGSFASSSTAGVSVSGGGTPNVGLTWGFTAVAGGGGGGGNNVEWDYYNGGVWNAVQLNNSGVNNTGSGTASHQLTFAPTGGFAVQLNSFALHGYYNSSETYDYTWSVLSGLTTLASGTYSFTSDGTGNHPININYTGGSGEVLVLDILRTGGSGSAFNIAVDNISFGQTAVPEPGAFALAGLGSLMLLARYRSVRKK
jgi:hypothetical protein